MLICGDIIIVVEETDSARLYDIKDSEYDQTGLSVK
jgi:hypothetical protein